jgi:hypothetical protein
MFRIVHDPLEFFWNAQLRLRYFLLKLRRSWVVTGIWGINWSVEPSNALDLHIIRNDGV